MEARLSERSRVRGALLGGALGDALGAPVEFMRSPDIVAKHGPLGITELASAYGRVGALTDDTQMTLFTAEGLLRAAVCTAHDSPHIALSMLHAAWLRWLLTQGLRAATVSFPADGWLSEQRALFSRRAPGSTCLASLAASGALGARADNDSKGCGAVMRVAPIGLLSSTPQVAFELACASAEITHGHASSTFASGCFAFLLSELMSGRSLREGIAAARAHVERLPQAREVCAAIDAAVGWADVATSLGPGAVERLGAGWVAEEALAIALFCGLRAQSFEHGVRLAVNHGGDSDSTGSLTGQLLGAQWGEAVLPARWLASLELRAVIQSLADDLTACRLGAVPDERRYPGS